MKLNDSLEQILDQLALLGAETALIIGAILVLMLGLVSVVKNVIKGTFLVVLLAAAYFQFQWVEEGQFMLGSIRFHAGLSSFSMLFLFGAAALLLFERPKKHAAEFYFFILAMVVGALILVKAGNLLIAYLSIELLSFCSYLLTTFSFRKNGFEAGLKYLLFGALSSAIMLFGIGLIYGAAGSMYFQDLQGLALNVLPVQAGLILFAAGILFKASVFPFHVWVPATYQSAPVDAVAFLSIVPKLAALVFFKELFTLHVLDAGQWSVIIIKCLGIATMIVGTLGAFRQHSVRRMISFGAIAHTGFLLPFVFVGSTTAADSFWYYSVVYLLMNLAVFYLVGQFEKAKVLTLDAYAGLGRNEILAGSLTLVLVSLIGIPPLAGFTAKFFLFLTLWEVYNTGHAATDLWYLLIAVAATVGSLFFYFKVPRAMYLESAKRAEAMSLKSSWQTKILATIFTVALLLLFFVPEIVQDLKQMLINVHE